jgi:hypothetical protein
VLPAAWPSPLLLHCLALLLALLLVLLLLQPVLLVLVSQGSM